MAKNKQPGAVVPADIIAAMDGPFAEWFPGETWSNWRAVLKAAYCLPMDADELTFFHEVAGGRAPPTKRVRELWLIIGRRGGKNAVSSAIVAHAAALFDGRRRQIAGITLPQMRKGERATILCLANDREQAGIALGYIESYFDEIPELAQMVTRRTRSSIELANEVDILVATNDFRGIRGRSVLVATLDECAFFRDENSASPDVELYNAITPGMLTLKDQAMLIGISTPHKKSGLLWNKFQQSYGADDPNVLVVKATSLQLNPTLPADEIEAEIAANPDLKRAEYLCEWRTDISSFVDPEVVDAAIVKGRHVISPHGQPCIGFIDVSGGVRDSHCCAIAFKDETDTSVLACAREIKTADTEAVVAEFATLLKSYGISTAFADKYGAEWVRGAFERHGIDLRQSPHTRSELYLNLLPALNAGQVRLLDLPRLRSQLLSLERRTIRGTGRDVVDHPAAGSDDLINAAAGSLVLAASADRRTVSFTMATNRSSFSTKDGGTYIPVAGQAPNRAFEAYLAEVKAEPDKPGPDDPDFENAMRIRAGVRVNGQPLPWREIMQRVQHERQLGGF